jgi:hypothetical protein
MLKNGIVDTKLLNNIKNNYPVTYEWIKNKAKIHHNCLGKILNIYLTEIKLKMNKEDQE